MAFISTEEVKNIRDQLKAAFPEFKFSVRRSHHTNVDVDIMSGPVDFSDILGKFKHTSINQYHLYQYGKHEELFSKMFDIIRSQNWYDESDSSIDYFHTAYYFSLGIGRWDKPYELKVKK